MVTYACISSLVMQMSHAELIKAEYSLRSKVHLYFCLNDHYANIKRSIVASILYCLMRLLLTE